MGWVSWRQLRHTIDDAGLISSEREMCQGRGIDKPLLWLESLCREHEYVREDGKDGKVGYEDGAEMELDYGSGVDGRDGWVRVDGEGG